MLLKVIGDESVFTECTLKQHTVLWLVAPKTPLDYEEQKPNLAKALGVCVETNIVLYEFEDPVDRTPKDDPVPWSATPASLGLTSWSMLYARVEGPVHLLSKGPPAMAAEDPPAGADDSAMFPREPSAVIRRGSSFTIGGSGGGRPKSVRIASDVIESESDPAQPRGRLLDDEFQQHPPIRTTSSLPEPDAVLAPVDAAPKSYTSPSTATAATYNSPAQQLVHLSPYERQMLEATYLSLVPPPSYLSMTFNAHTYIYFALGNWEPPAATGRLETKSVLIVHASGTIQLCEVDGKERFHEQVRHVVQVREQYAYGGEDPGIRVTIYVKVKVPGQDAPTAMLGGRKGSLEPLSPPLSPTRRSSATPSPRSSKQARRMQYMLDREAARDSGNESMQCAEQVEAMPKKNNRLKMFVRKMMGKNARARAEAGSDGNSQQRLMGDGSTGSLLGLAGGVPGERQVRVTLRASQVRQLRQVLDKLRPHIGADPLYWIDASSEKLPNPPDSPGSRGRAIYVEFATGQTPPASVGRQHERDDAACTTVPPPALSRRRPPPLTAPALTTPDRVAVGSPQSPEGDDWGTSPTHDGDALSASVSPPVRGGGAGSDAPPPPPAPNTSASPAPCRTSVSAPSYPGPYSPSERSESYASEDRSSASPPPQRAPAAAVESPSPRRWASASGAAPAAKPCPLRPVPQRSGGAVSSCVDAPLPGEVAATATAPAPPPWHLQSPPPLPSDDDTSDALSAAARSPRGGPPPAVATPAAADSDTCSYDTLPVDRYGIYGTPSRSVSGGSPATARSSRGVYIAASMSPAAASPPYGGGTHTQRSMPSTAHGYTGAERASPGYREGSVGGGSWYTRDVVHAPRAGRGAHPNLSTGASGVHGAYSSPAMRSSPAAAAQATYPVPLNERLRSPTLQREASAQPQLRDVRPQASGELGSTVTRLSTSVISPQPSSGLREVSTVTSGGDADGRVQALQDALHVRIEELVEKLRDRENTIREQDEIILEHEAAAAAAAAAATTNNTHGGRERSPAPAPVASAAATAPAEPDVQREGSAGSVGLADLHRALRERMSGDGAGAGSEAALSQQTHPREPVYLADGLPAHADDAALDRALRARYLHEHEANHKAVMRTVLDAHLAEVAGLRAQLQEAQAANGKYEQQIEAFTETCTSMRGLRLRNDKLELDIRHRDKALEDYEAALRSKDQVITSLQLEVQKLRAAVAERSPYHRDGGGHPDRTPVVARADWVFNL